MRIEAELAGLTEGERVSDRAWLVPPTAMVQRNPRDDEAYLRFDPPFLYTGVARAGANLLPRFLRLRRANEAELVRFAQEFGPLDLQLEPRPNGVEVLLAGPDVPQRVLIPDTPMLPPPTEWGSPRIPLGYRRERTFHEPVRLWRQLAGQLHALYMASARLAQGELVASEDFAELTKLVSYPLRPDADATAEQAAADAIDAGIPTLLDDPDTIAGQRRLVTLLVESLLGLAQVGPRFHWAEAPDARPQLTLGGSGLLGALVVRLMVAIAGAEGLAICSACGLPFVPRRRPVATRRRYCDVCRDDRQPQRDAEAAARQRKRATSAPGAQ